MADPSQKMESIMDDTRYRTPMNISGGKMTDAGYQMMVSDIRSWYSNFCKKSFTNILKIENLSLKIAYLVTCIFQ